MNDALEKSILDLSYAIGSLFINVGALEHTLNLTLAAALGLSVFQERALLRGMNSGVKIDMLRQFAKKTFLPEALEKLKILMKEASAIAEFRNDIAHGLLTYDAQGTHHVITFRGENRFDGKVTELTASGVNDFAVRAIELAGQLHALLNALERQQQRAMTPLPTGHPST